MTPVTVASMVVEESSVKRQVVLGMGRTVLVTAIVTGEQEHASATQDGGGRVVRALIVPRTVTTAACVTRLD